MQKNRRVRNVESRDLSDSILGHNKGSIHYKSNTTTTTSPARKSANRVNHGYHASVVEK